MSRRLAVAVLIVLATCAGTVSAGEPPPCESDSSYALLDFWLGDWNVYVENDLVATDHIERILEGCAVEENWTAANGDQGLGLFYYQKTTGQWKQVWLTSNSPKFGGCKEKVLTERYDGGGLRFEGEIPGNSGSRYFERTTIRPLADGRIHQVIEVSRDNNLWRKISDVHYVRK